MTDRGGGHDERDEIPSMLIPRRHDERAPHSEPVGPRPPPPPRVSPTDGVRDLASRVPWLVGTAFIALAAVFLVVGIGLVLAGLWLGWFFIFFPVLHLMTGLGLRRAATSIGSDARIARDGVAAIGRVVRIAPDRQRTVNDQPTWKLTWSYAVEGTQHFGETWSTESPLQDMTEGDAIWVLYDPERPERSTEWPRLEP